jgi:hypothetical protein
MTSKYLSKNKSELYFGDVDSLSDLITPIIDILKNKKIKKYFNDNVNNIKNVDELWELFYHCINMSIDRDVDEYINALKALEEND